MRLHFVLGEYEHIHLRFWLRLDTPRAGREIVAKQGRGGKLRRTSFKSLRRGALTPVSGAGEDGEVKEIECLSSLSQVFQWIVALHFLENSVGEAWVRNRNRRRSLGSESESSVVHDPCE